MMYRKGIIAVQEKCVRLLSAYEAINDFEPHEVWSDAIQQMEEMISLNTIAIKMDIDYVYLSKKDLLALSVDPADVLHTLEYKKKWIR